LLLQAVVCAKSWLIPRLISSALRLLKTFHCFHSTLRNRRLIQLSSYEQQLAAAALVGVYAGTEMLGVEIPGLPFFWCLGTLWLH
jgi:hypothetical protein